MPAYPVRALVLKRTKLGEADVIVTLLREDGRQVRAVAKGMRKPTSRFAGRLQPYASVDLLLHSGRTFEIVSEAQSVEPRAALREDYDRNAAAAVVTDVLDKISLEGMAEERLFALSSVSLDTMATAQLEALPQLVTAFLLKAMSMHGYRPQLDACAGCGGELGASRAFAMESGGALCETCAASIPASTQVAPETRQWMATLLASTMAEVSALEMPRAAVRDVFELTRAFVAYHLPARLRALDFYAGMLGQS